MRNIQANSPVQPETIEDIIFPEADPAGEGDLPLLSGTAMLAIRMAAELKQLRIDRSLPLDELAEKVGLDMATLSRLEDGRIFNPRLDTLLRYALALGYEVQMRYVPLNSNLT